MDKINTRLLHILENSNDAPPSTDIIMNLAKNFSELKVFEKAIKLYDFLIKINDQEVKNII